MSDTFLWTLSVHDRIAVLNDHPIFLPGDFIWGKLVPSIAVVVVALAAAYTIFFQAISIVYYDASKLTLETHRKVAYQFTNLCVNFGLGSFGLYYYLFRLPDPATLEQQIYGLEQELYLFSCFQLGYQLWALPMGIFLVRESPAILIHHMTVVIVTSMSTFMTNGFRYWTPFFYGVLEISSVPLSVMNTFKDNPSWIQAYPLLYLIIRLAFAVSFLIIRVYLLLPQKLRFLRDHLLLLVTSSSRLYQFYMAFVWLSSLTLLCLQIFWATLIIKGLANAFLPKKKKVLKQV